MENAKINKWFHIKEFHGQPCWRTAMLKKIKHMLLNYIHSYIHYYKNVLSKLQGQNRICKVSKPFWSQKNPFYKEQLLTLE